MKLAMKNKNPLNTNSFADLTSGCDSRTGLQYHKALECLFRGVFLIFFRVLRRFMNFMWFYMQSFERI